MKKGFKLKGAAVKKELKDLIVSKLRAIAPRKDGVGSIEVCRTNREILSKIRYVLMTGIRSFDRITGAFPFGRVTEVYGLEACGKTALCIKSALQSQRRQIFEKIEDPDDPTKRVLVPIPDESEVSVLYVDNEQSIEDDEKVIIDGEELDINLARCDTVDQLFKIIDNTIDVVDKYEAETKIKQFVVVIVDTIAGTSSKEEMGADWGKDDYNRQPKQLKQAFRRMTRKINRRNVCMICTNQVSDTFQKSYGGGKSLLPTDKDFSTFGGKALKYYSSLRVFMQSIPFKYKLVKESKFAAGLCISFFTSKNRQLKPLREGRMVLLFDGGLSDTFSLLETLIYLDFAVCGDDGKVSFRFKHWNIPTTTFGPVKEDKLVESTANDMALLILEEEEIVSGAKKKKKLVDPDSEPAEKVKKEKNPSIPEKSAWPAFYAEHKADFDVMWEHAIKYVFTTEGINGYIANEEDEDTDDIGDEND